MSYATAGIVGVIIGAIIGAVVVFFIKRKMDEKLVQTYVLEKVTEVRNEMQQRVTNAEMEAKMADEKRLDFQNHQAILFQQQQERFENEKHLLEERYQSEKQTAKEQFEKELQALATRLDEEKQRFEKEKTETKAETERQWAQNMELLKAEFEKISQKHLDHQHAKIQESNHENVSQLLSPLKEKIKDFSEAFSQNKDQQISLKTAVETAIRGLQDQTLQLQKDTENLTKALKANPKKQGDWGEAILKNILDASGLRENYDYVLQLREKSHEQTFIPDVQIRLPKQSESDEEGFLIIDSKVSITHYLSYMQTENEIDRKQYLKLHLDSVRKHYKELSSKDYGTKVKNTVGYVMMFMPNEGSYLLAMENDPQLALDAYRDHVIIINPTNLMLALNIVRLLWQSQRQTDNVREIINSANKIYEKFTGIAKNLCDLGNHIDRTHKTYKGLRSQFCQGRGNLVRQFENWRELGIPSSKRIPLQSQANSCDEEEVSLNELVLLEKKEEETASKQEG